MIQTVRGVHDILPVETPLWQLLEARALAIFGQYGFAEIRTPLFEKTELFARAVGAATDIVEKEMYTFADRGGDSLSLRPEGTASVVRTFVQQSMHRQLPWKVWYRGPMFRYERPQKGRQRQFHQIGCELFGPAGPLADAELMAMVMRYLTDLGLQASLVLEINSLGCPDCRAPYRDLLIATLRTLVAHLCEDCQNRIERNPLRVLDCKRENCRATLANAPSMLDHLCAGCANHFSSLKTHLNHLGIPYRVNPFMVRGLDYYNRTAFEVTSTGLGAQNAVAAGGRYDGLVAQMGGTSTPAIGFAMGMERLVLLLNRETTLPSSTDVFLATLGERGENAGLLLAEAIRKEGLAVELNLSGGSLKSQMKRADRSKARFALMLGDTEIEKNVVIVKDMTLGQQQEIRWSEAPVFLANLCRVGP
ncbi:MAG: histidyl-tRNA synthetase [Magnetococcales bacterium]|nr:histidyl-tRNA synthetase [Magnetococcales bacterium]HIJ84349.1 histidine--tRNA ligase [Magnetococcales bacterium]